MTRRNRGKRDGSEGEKEKLYRESNPIRSAVPGRSEAALRAALFPLRALFPEGSSFRSWTAPVMMRPDSDQIHAKIPSFILISCFLLLVTPLVASPPLCNPIHTSPRPLITLRQDALSLALSIVSATPRGLSSLSTTLRCSIYKRSFPKRARFFQPAGDKFLDLAFLLFRWNYFHDRSSVLFARKRLRRNAFHKKWEMSVRI